MDIYTTTLDNPNASDAVVISESDKMPTDWSPDGKHLAYADLAPGKTYDVWVKPLEPSGQPVAVAITDFQEAAGAFSPDGTLLAYLAVKNRRPEIYVRSFPNGADRKVSPPWLGGKWLRGDDYLLHVAVPNFFFHVTTAYAILRHNGVPLGKMDFIGSMPVQDG